MLNKLLSLSLSDIADVPAGRRHNRPSDGTVISRFTGTTSSATLALIIAGILGWTALSLIGLQNEAVRSKQVDLSFEDRLSAIEVSGVDDRIRKTQADDIHEAMTRGNEITHGALRSAIQAQTSRQEDFRDQVIGRFLRNEEMINRALTQNTDDRFYKTEEAHRDNQRTLATLEAMDDRLEAITSRYGAGMTVNIANEKRIDLLQQQVQILTTRMRDMGQSRRTSKPTSPILSSGKKR